MIHGLPECAAVVASALQEVSHGPRPVTLTTLWALW